MGKRKVTTGKPQGNETNLGFEAKLWLAADKLRYSVGVAEFRDIVLGLIFLKCISGSFEEMYQRLCSGKGRPRGC